MEISTGIQAFIVALQDWALGFFFSSFLMVLYPTHVWKGGVGGGGVRWGGADDKAKKRKTGQHLNVHLRDCPRAEECPHEFVEVSTQE